MTVTAVLIGLAALIVGALLLMTAAPLYLMTVGTYRIATESRTWPTVRGTITEAAVRSNRRANGLPGYRYVLRYTYEVNRREYDSKLVAAGAFPYGSLAWATRRVGSYPVGHWVIVRYDPSDPQIAVLEPGWRLECWYFIAATGALLMCGLAGVIWGSLQIFDALF